MAAVLMVAVVMTAMGLLMAQIAASLAAQVALAVQVTLVHLILQAHTVVVPEILKLLFWRFYVVVPEILTMPISVCNTLCTDRPAWDPLKTGLKYHEQ